MQGQGKHVEMTFPFAGITYYSMQWIHVLAVFHTAGRSGVTSNI